MRYRMLKMTPNKAADELQPEAYRWGTLRIARSRERS